MIMIHSIKHKIVPKRLLLEWFCYPSNAFLFDAEVNINTLYFSKVNTEYDISKLHSYNYLKDQFSRYF